MARVCSFCGKEEDKNKKVVKSPINDEIFICDRCTKIIATAAGMGIPPKIKTPQQEQAEEIVRRTPRQIHAELDRFIIGQEEAKKTLSVAIYNHYKRLYDKTGTIQKSNILLAGPSGTGKTLLAKTIAKMLGLPCAIADITSMTPAGYAGDDLEICLQRLLQEAGGDLERAQRGIVFLDEIDKIAKSGDTSGSKRDVCGEGMQVSLLKLVEGTTVSVPLTGCRKTSSSETVLFDTSQVLFIVGGAFEGMIPQEEAKEEVSVSIGFCREEAEELCEKTTAQERHELDQEMLIAYGMMREFVGRFPNLVELKPLEEDDLMRILTAPENAITKEYQALFRQDNVELIFQEAFLRGIAREAIARNVGARGLRSILEKTMRDLMYDLPDREGLEVCVLTDWTLSTGEPELLFAAPPFDPATGKRRDCAELSA